MLLCSALHLPNFAFKGLFILLLVTGIKWPIHVQSIFYSKYFLKHYALHVVFEIREHSLRLSLYFMLTVGFCLWDCADLSRALVATVFQS